MKMDSSDLFNFDVKVKDELKDVSLVENNYDVIDKIHVNQNIHFPGFLRENSVRLVRFPKMTVMVPRIHVIYSYKHTLKVHMDSIHYKITHVCDICGKSFKKLIFELMSMRYTRTSNINVIHAARNSQARII
ncbi:uncharacterized protein LOC106651055 [Trichogramma pretiosum]|uniref:uncharacterized protein LOC106651055 n=1 Tax=Trichogramma pretiosum TaxID=7493 RepID=UPI0006C9C5A9|nr:uncharacterized protein LOC106651055 [Trichogramma pretiosum]